MPIDQKKVLRRRSSSDTRGRVERERTSRSTRSASASAWALAGATRRAAVHLRERRSRCCRPSAWCRRSRASTSTLGIPGLRRESDDDPARRAVHRGARDEIPTRAKIDQQREGQGHLRQGQGRARHHRSDDQDRSRRAALQERVLDLRARRRRLRRRARPDRRATSRRSARPTSRSSTRRCTHQAIIYRLSRRL